MQIMTLEVLQKEMVAAMKEHNKIRKETISSLIGAVKKAAIDKLCKDNITEELVNEVLLKEKKTMQEMIDTCPVERVATLEEYYHKMSIINEFVPKMMTEEEIRQTIHHLIATVDGVEYGNKGSIMKVASPVLKGKADMKLVNQIVTEICSKVK
jgi:uncharacterized protein YqeY